MTKCYCGSLNAFQACCEPFIKGTQKAPTAEALMRSRYSAYVVQAADYLIETTHISERKCLSKTAILDWAKNNHWLKLEVIKCNSNTVEFKAYFLDETRQPQVHHEFSTFKQEAGIWYYVDGRFYE